MDLSKVLGDVYADNTPAATEAGPDWADEAHLDQAFANWTPGPPADAPAAEREMAAHIAVDSSARRRIDDDLATALTEALTPSPVSATADLVAEIPALQREPLRAVEPVRVWSRGDDDVLPSRGGSRKRGFRR